MVISCDTGEARAGSSSSSISNGYNNERKQQGAPSSSRSDSSGSQFQSGSRNMNNYHSSNQNGYPEHRNHSKNNHSKDFNQKNGRSGWDRFNRLEFIFYIK